MCSKGFEPPTHGLEGRCSIQLSYEHKSGILIIMNLLEIFFIQKRVMGIEPTYLAWKASVLPLNYTRMKWLFSFKNYRNKIGVTGFEPATSWSQTRRSSQAEPHPVTSFRDSQKPWRKTYYIIRNIECQHVYQTFFYLWRCIFIL